MDDQVGLGMDKQSHLLANRLDDLGMTMTGIGHADATGEVEQFTPIVGVDVRALGAFRNKVKDARPGGGHVGEVLFVEGICWHICLSEINWLTFITRD